MMYKFCFGSIIFPWFDVCFLFAFGMAICDSDQCQERKKKKKNRDMNKHTIN